ncbi:hypothetical protein E2C01_055968 [Portunus trituberculatus]|uniref:Uncharacterized protein n=1 Tax=Portunus trituberculatus TaxID=210409 RepID=A0A5B7GP48_PORTR|nr:hypothetical protein [Portunus trituberculatus]
MAVLYSRYFPWGPHPIHILRRAGLSLSTRVSGAKKFWDRHISPLGFPHPKTPDSPQSSKLAGARWMGGGGWREQII